MVHGNHAIKITVGSGVDLANANPWLPSRVFLSIEPKHSNSLVRGQSHFSRRQNTYLSRALGGQTNVRKVGEMNHPTDDFRMDLRLRVPAFVGEVLVEPRWIHFQTAIIRRQPKVRLLILEPFGIQAWENTLLGTENRHRLTILNGHLRISHNQQSILTIHKKRLWGTYLVQRRRNGFPLILGPATEDLSVDHPDPILLCGQIKNRAFRRDHPRSRRVGWNVNDVPDIEPGPNASQFIHGQRNHPAALCRTRIILRWNSPTIAIQNQQQTPSAHNQAPW